MRQVDFKKKLKKPRHFLRKRICRLCKDKVEHIDYKDIKRLERFVSDRGKIISRRSSGNCARHQRMVARAIKRARCVAILPYVKYSK